MAFRLVETAPVPSGAVLGVGWIPPGQAVAVASSFWGGRASEKER
jgi:hypothetical protein